MTATSFHTVVVWSPPTPLGLLAGEWVMAHRCTRCGERVPTADLVLHAEAHGTNPVVEDIP